MGDAPAQGDRATLEHCRDPGFTPGARDVEGLLELWENTRPPKAATVVVRALARGDQGVAGALRRGWATAKGKQRAVRLQVLSRIAGRIDLPELALLLPEALRDPEPKVVREAARAVGKLDELDPSVYETTLLSIVERAQLPEQRAAVEALGRIGGPQALAQLQALKPTDDDLARRTAEAITLITRRAQRGTTSHVRLDRRLPRPVTVALRCRRGAATVVDAQARALLPEASGLGIERKGPGSVRLRWSGPLEELYRVRSCTEVALRFPLPAGNGLVDRIVTGLEQPALEAALCTWTEGSPRFRLTFGSGGRRRATIWKVAQRLAEHGSPLANDSREIGWTVEIDEPGAQLWCLPRGADPRFTYRQHDVPAATHPTLAALLAWAGAPQPGEIVWDPFCGSGSELVEATKLASGLHLWGTDVSAPALEAARTNLAAAQLDAASVHLDQGSALDTTPTQGDRPVSLILSNPPMGRRVMVDDERGVRRLLADFITHAARVLGPGGRLVWLSPAPSSTAHLGRQHGFEVEDLDRIDMGGFFTTPQILRKPA